ncbi:restriction modification system DNA specificity subunit [Alishewanella agri BL06]|uniref:Restriction modification system DNA specificity subunit n=1 Tax=Alishewanella agri BL06 TaxID=1195246 RepID=I8U6V9_9ALTE|nr:restriction endonuclease subunit S [Alishewanella agri]EIW89056.1 restriction modification system DNA specificity subunit [Alishewanella agri BL06]
MSFSSYPTYKDSNIEWLSSIPVDWQFSKLKFVTTCNDEVLPENFDPEEEINYIEISDVSLNLGVTNLSTLAFGVAPSRARRVVRHGDILISTVRTYLKAIAQVTYPEPKTIASTGFAVIRPKESYSTSGFLKHLAHAEGFIGEVISRSTGVSYPAINASELISIDLPLPPINEQTQIVRFLDHEVGKIDALIAEQEKLIALLKEKRQAVISHAVTKGLNPDVPMKESGVEWLGQVPEHWLVKKFGFLANVVRGGSPRPAGDPELFNGDFSPWVTVAEITKDDSIYLNETESFLTQKGSEQCRVFKSGTLVLSNSGATLGVPKILAIDANANDGVVGFEDLKISSVFCYLLLDSMTVDLRERVKQGSGQPNLNTDIVKNIFIAVPPTEEIENIVNFSLKVREQFSKLINEAATFSNLLSERRSALISAAVTGKIDVRGWQPPAAQ